MAENDKPIYDTLAVPAEATANGGVEILRAGLVDDELYVTARHAFKDPADWGEVLADITRRLALLYSMETDLSEAEALAEIEEAYAAEMGAREVPEQMPDAASSAERAPRALKRKAASEAKPSAKPRRKRPVPPPSESEG
jgi:hypothetical protein